MFRQIVIRIFTLLLVIGLLNLIYTFTLYKKDLLEKSPEIVRLRQSIDSTDVYYFGESSNITFSETDSTKESISSLTARYFPDLHFTNINKYATHVGIYKEWLEALPMEKQRPKAVIITLNLRSFDAAWIHSKLETQLRESLVMAQPYPKIINRFLLSLQAFDNKTEEQREQEMLRDWRTVPLHFPFDFRYRTVAEWDQAMAQGSYLKADGSWDTDKIALACHYIKGYAFNIDEDNPRINDLDVIASWGESNNIPVYLNLMAENIEYADSLVGKELVFLMRQNRDYLIRRYHRGNCMVVDNLEAVKGKDFIDQNWTTEHYNQRGRMTIARNLADTLRSRIKEKHLDIN
jgi:hypothetical protein